MAFTLHITCKHCGRAQSIVVEQGFHPGDVVYLKTKKRGVVIMSDGDEAGAGRILVRWMPETPAAWINPIHLHKIEEPLKCESCGEELHWGIGGR